jgi:hypothetical protein
LLYYGAKKLFASYSATEYQGVVQLVIVLRSYNVVQVVILLRNDKVDMLLHVSFKNHGA